MITDLFGIKPRRKPRVMMHVVDAGIGPGHEVIQFECKCGYNTGWIKNEQSVWQNKRGMPCPVCNPTPASTCLDAEILKAHTRDFGVASALKLLNTKNES